MPETSNLQNSRFFLERNGDLDISFFRISTRGQTLGMLLLIIILSEKDEQKRKLDAISILV